MPNVLHIRASGELLGAERVVLELIENLPDFGYQTFVGIPIEADHPNLEFASEAQEQSQRVKTFPITGPFDFSLVKSIRKFIQNNNIDIVHTHGYREDLYAVLARLDVALIATNHLWKRTNLKLKLYSIMDAWLLRSFDAIIAVSEQVKKDMLSMYLSEKKISVVANGINTHLYSNPVPRDQALNSFQIPSEKTVVGTISSLTSEKGIDDLITALYSLRSQAPYLHLLIVGSGDQQENLKQQADTLGISQSITFAGRQSDINRMLSAMDIFALPSLNEGLPMALLEAMAAGKPAVASDVGDVSVAITSDTGLLVHPGSPSELAHAILSLLNAPQQRIILGENARRCVNGQFSAHAMASEYAKIYDEVLTGRRSKF